MRAKTIKKRDDNRQASPFFTPVIQRDPEGGEDQRFKLLVPAFGESLYKPRQYGLDLPKLELDPELEAKMQVFRLLHGQLSFDHLWQASSLLQSPQSSTVPNLLYPPPDYFANQPPPINFNLPPVKPQKPAVPAGKGPAKAKKATTGDLIKAVLAIPAVKEKLDELKGQATDMVEEQWDSFATGTQISIISGGVILGAGATYGLYQMPADQRRPLLKPISGMMIPIPKTPLSLQYTQTDKSEQIMLHLNVGKILPKRFGFK